MKRLFSVMTMFCLMLLGAAPVQAQNPAYICAHMPMYQVSGGWYHYATVHAANCAYLYPTGLVHDLLPSQNCANNDCLPLGGKPDDLPSFYFTQKPKPYVEMLADGDIRTFLLDEFGGPINEYGSYIFTFRTTVKLYRADGKTEFYASVFEMRHRTIRNWYSLIGVEISEPGDSNPITRFRQCNATHTYKEGENVYDVPVPGLLYVQLSPVGDTAVIRLYKDSNKDALFPVCPIPKYGEENGKKLDGMSGQFEGSGLSKVAATNCEICDPSVVSSDYVVTNHATRRVRFRKHWR